MTANGSSYDAITLGNGAGELGNGQRQQPRDNHPLQRRQNQIVAAPGDVWTVGSGQDTFAFNAGFGNNTVTDFNTSRDVLQFNHALFVNFAAAMADTKQVRSKHGHNLRCER